MDPEKITLIEAQARDAQVLEITNLLKAMAPGKGVMVTSVAAGLMAEVMVSSGFVADDLVNLMHGEEDEETEGRKAAFTACAEHVRESSKFGGVMYKMLMGLLGSTSTGEKKIPLQKPAVLNSSRGGFQPRMVLQDVESDDETDTVAQSVKFSGRKTGLDGSDRFGVNGVDPGAGFAVSKYVQKGISLGLVTDEWPSEEEIDNFTLGDAPELAERSRLRMRHSQVTLSKLLAKVLDCQSKGKAGDLSVTFEKLRSHVFTLASDINRRGGEVAASTGLVYGWWNSASEMLQGNSMAHAMYIEKYLGSSKGLGLHVVVDMTSMFIVFGRMIGGSAGSSAEGREEELNAFKEEIRVSVDREMQSLKDKVKTLTTRLQKERQRRRRWCGHGRIWFSQGCQWKVGQVLQVQQDGALQGRVPRGHAGVGRGGGRVILRGRHYPSPQHASSRWPAVIYDRACGKERGGDSVARGG